MKQLQARQPCPCGRLRGAAKAGQQETYGNCCGRWLEPSVPAATPPDAETLMRSRYSAFVLEREAYLLQSWAASHRPERIECDPATKWLGLDVRAYRLTGETTAEVEFVARQKPAQGPAVRLHERSRFVRETGRWLYLDGDPL
jgi:SEC-C motif-containing protein